MEKRLTEIERDLIKFATDSFKVNELFTEQTNLSQQLEQTIERWTELAEKADF